jgi:hypothetical protein
MASLLEKCVIDVIRVALNRLDQRERITILSGMLVIEAKEFGASLEKLHEYIEARYQEHDETVG